MLKDKNLPSQSLDQLIPNGYYLFIGNEWSSIVEEDCLAMTEQPMPTKSSHVRKGTIAISLLAFLVFFSLGLYGLAQSKYEITKHLNIPKLTIFN